ncbi:hypothetical protein [Microbulbifer sp. JMSA002]|uniref:hypothetical protein n=1 Tax=Microbulbifer sp. JMSA002 TaxID=3243368 RepID=UPI004039C48E
METWQAILVAFGGNAVLIAVLAWLAKSLITEWLKRGGVDRQIIYSKLHEKRTEAVSAIYVGLIKYVSLCKSFILSAPHVDEEERQELLSQLTDGSGEFRDIFQSNKLYLSKNLCDQIEQAFKDTQMPSYKYIFALGAYSSGGLSESQHEEEWAKAYKSFSEQVPVLLESLENEFRALLRSEKYS